MLEFSLPGDEVDFFKGKVRGLAGLDVVAVLAGAVLCSSVEVLMAEVAVLLELSGRMVLVLGLGAATVLLVVVVGVLVEAAAEVDLDVLGGNVVVFLADGGPTVLPGEGGVFAGRPVVCNPGGGGCGRGGLVRGSFPALGAGTELEVLIPVGTVAGTLGEALGV